MPGPGVPGAGQVVMDVDDHDAAVARVSHLPHLMSVLMAGPPDRRSRGGPAAGRPGSARRDPDRRQRSRAVGADLGANSAAVLAELRHVRDELAVLINALEAAPATADSRDQLERGVAGTQKIPGKHGAAQSRYSQVVVEIPDAPGALGRLFAEVGAAGVNVEDISIEHDQVREVGYLAFSVAPDRAGGLTQLMTNRGWTSPELARAASRRAAARSVSGGHRLRLSTCLSRRRPR